MAIHTEKAFEETVEGALLAQGYTQRPHAAYDPDKALIPDALFEFLARSQPQAWAKLKATALDKAETEVLKAIEGVRTHKATGSTLRLLREGFEAYGVKFKACYFKPNHGINPDNLRLYEANELSVVRQVRFMATSNESVDLVLFLNGIPVITAELKNPMTGQRFHHAEQQYMGRPAGAPLFTFRRGALVHFAIDPEYVTMTTHLAGGDTRWLPFNLGNPNAPKWEKATGNPIGPDGKYRTYYLWEEVWAPDSLLELVGSFINEEREKPGSPVKAILFPRYHQLDVVRKLKADARAYGAGKRYLVQHSAGSGKTNSIAWLSFHLATLHNEQDEKVFSSVVVISDRRVLDGQLQRAISSLDHKPGFVATIDRDSTQLADALSKGTPIVITTLQKFPFVVDKVKDLSGRRYAVIVDEAHSSQGSDASKKMVEVLDAGPESDGEDEVNAQITKLGNTKQISFFAFTATPKAKTLNLFGQTTSGDEKPKAFHYYTMRQAIDEGFILDVLQHYTTYDTYFKLTKAIEEDPELNTKKANKAIGKYLNMHPTHIESKSEVIVEHFRSAVKNKIGGKAKAMVVTSSRELALRTYQALGKYIKEKHYADIGLLVAFSGELTDPITQKSITEVNINKFGEKELPEKFRNGNFHLLVVADKYQTGFDEPLLHTMYLDKKVSGVQAVQTLSRLNRTHAGKNDTFVLDFANRREDILTAFQEFYERTELEEATDPGKLEELRLTVMDFQVIDESEMQHAYQLLTGTKREHLTKSQHQQLESYLNPAVDRYKLLEEGMRDKFRKDLLSFTKLYGWMWQLLPFESDSLDKLHLYGKYLIRKLPKEDLGPALHLDDELALQFYRLDKSEDGKLELQAGDGKPLRGPSAIGSGKIKDKREPLSVILDKVNEKLGTEFSEGDRLFLEQVMFDHQHDEELKAQAQANSFENFSYGFVKKFNDALLARHENNQVMVSKLYQEGELRRMVLEWMMTELYTEFKQKVA